MVTTLNLLAMPTLSAAGVESDATTFMGVDLSHITLWHVAAVALALVTGALFVMLRQRASAVTQLKVECGRLQQLNSEVVSQRNDARNDAETRRHELIAAKSVQAGLDTYFEQVNNRMEQRLQEGVQRALADHGNDLAPRLTACLDEYQGRSFDELSAPVLERLEQLQASIGALATQQPTDTGLPARLERIESMISALGERDAEDPALHARLERLETGIAELGTREKLGDIDGELRPALERMEASISSMREQVGVDAGLRECLERLESSVHASLAHEKVDTELHARMERLESAIREMPHRETVGDEVGEKISRIQSALETSHAGASADADLCDRLERIEASIAELREHRSDDSADERLEDIIAAQSEMREQMQHIIYALPRYEFVGDQTRISSVSTPADYVAAFGRKVHANQTGRNVLFADGNVRWFAEEDLPALVEEQNILRSKDDMPPIAVPGAGAPVASGKATNKNGHKARLAS